MGARGPCTRVLFFEVKWNEKHPSKETGMCLRAPDGPFTQACLASQMTSCTEGTAPSTPPGTNPKSDIAKALAAVQTRNICQRRSDALRLSCWSSSGSSRTLAQANADKNSAVSSDHRPPTSAPQTTSQALPPWPASSGYVRSFRRRAFSRASPFFSAAPRIALPSRCRGHTNVVSMANWAPPWRGGPSATTSKRLLSTTLCWNRSKSRTKTFERTRSPPSRQTLAAADSSAHPLRPNTPAVAHTGR